MLLARCRSGGPGAGPHPQPQGTEAWPSQSPELGGHFLPLSPLPCLGSVSLGRPRSDPLPPEPGPLPSALPVPSAVSTGQRGLGARSCATWTGPGHGWSHEPFSQLGALVSASLKWVRGGSRSFGSAGGPKSRRSEALDAGHIGDDPARCDARRAALRGCRPQGTPTWLAHWGQQLARFWALMLVSVWGRAAVAGLGPPRAGSGGLGGFLCPYGHWPAHASELQVCGGDTEAAVLPWDLQASPWGADGGPCGSLPELVSTIAERFPPNPCGTH